MEQNSCSSPATADFTGVSFRHWSLLLEISIQNNFDDNNLQEHYYSFWNNSTSKSVNLPPLKLCRDQIVYDEVLLPDDDDDGGVGSSRKTLTLLVFESTMPCILYYQLLIDDSDDLVARDGVWRSILYGEEIEAYYKQHAGAFWIGDYPLYLDQPVCCQGKLYALIDYDKKLVEMKINMDNDNGNRNGLVIKSLGCDMPRGINISVYSMRTLVESEGELFWIVCGFGGIDYKEVIEVSVFKLNFFTWTWAKLDSIEDRMLFLCSQSQVEKTGGRGGGNCIYFTRAEDEEKCLYCYQMKDNSVSVLLPCNSLATSRVSPTWVTPDTVNLEGYEVTTSQQTGSSLVGNKNNVNVENCDMEMSKEVIETLDICGLPIGVLGDISDKLFLFDYMNFRLACKMFSVIAPPIRWKAKLTGSRQQLAVYFSYHPWLVIPGDKTNCDKDIWSFHDPNIVGSKYLITVPELLREVTIRCSKNGWLLLSCSQNQGTIIFFNPFRKSMIPLPSLLDHMDGPIVGFTFSSSPTSGACLVVAITWDGAIYVSDMNHWYVAYEDNYDYMPNFNNPVFWNGATYFLDNDGNLGVLKIRKNRTYEWEVLDEPKKPCDSFRQNFLVECGGELISVFVGFMGSSVDLFKFNVSKLVWERLESLGNFVLYISRFSSFATLVESLEMQNRIYFPRFHGESLVYYSLNTGKFHSVGSNDSFTDYVGTREQLLCGWIEPRLF